VLADSSGRGAGEFVALVVGVLYLGAVVLGLLAPLWL